MHRVCFEVARTLSASSACLVAALVSAEFQPARAGIWNAGDVFVGVGSGKYRVYDNDGVFKETIDSGLRRSEMAGGAFDSNFDLYTTAFQDSRVVVFDSADPHSVVETIDAGVHGACKSESLVFDASGDFYVGSDECSGDIQKFSAAGAFLAAYDVAVEARGSDWLDLAADQHTIYYTSEGRLIKRFDVASDTQLPDFATLPGPGVAYAFRLLPPYDGSGGLLIADAVDVKRLDASGAVVQTYSHPGEDYWFALALDPNGTSFWSAGSFSHRLYRFDIASGALEVGPVTVPVPFSIGIGHLIVRGERAGGSVAPDFVSPTPCGTTLMASVGVPFSFTVTATDDPGDVVTLTASGLPAGSTMTPALRTSGNPASSVLSWTPTNAETGTFVITFTATDGAGNQVTCDVTVIVAECHLIRGVGDGNSQVSIFGHLYTTQMSWVRSTHPVTMQSIPSFPLPQSSGQLASLVRVPISVQVVMYNPEVFPANPDQWSERLTVVELPDGSIDVRHSGTSNGIHVTHEVFLDESGKRWIRFPFTIDGM